MAAFNRMTSFLATMKWEGGDRLSLDRRDPGNWTGGKVGVGALKGTKWGVAASAHPKLDIADLTAEQALAIFLDGYWRPVGADDLPAGLDHAASDDAYNAGPGAASRRLARIARSASGSTVAAHIHAYSQLRLSFLESLKSWRAFQHGWAPRVAGVEAESLKMAMAAQTLPPAGDRAAPMWRSSFLTPADAPPRHDAISLESLAKAGVDADEAAKNARSHAALIGVASAGAAVWRGEIAPPWLVLLGAAAAILLIAWLWAGRAHAARRDALSDLVSELSDRSID